MLVLLDCFRALSTCSLVLLFSWVGFMDLVGMSWVGWSIGWLVGWRLVPALVGRSICWSVDWLVGRLIGWSVGQLVGWLDCD